MGGFFLAPAFGGVLKSDSGDVCTVVLGCTAVPRLSSKFSGGSTETRGLGRLQNLPLFPKPRRSARRTEQKYVRTKRTTDTRGRGKQGTLTMRFFCLAPDAKLLP